MSLIHVQEKKKEKRKEEGEGSTDTRSLSSARRGKKKGKGGEKRRGGEKAAHRYKRDPFLPHSNQISLSSPGREKRKRERRKRSGGHKPHAHKYVTLSSTIYQEKEKKEGRGKREQTVRGRRPTLNFVAAFVQPLLYTIEKKGGRERGGRGIALKS